MLENSTMTSAQSYSEMDINEYKKVIQEVMAEARGDLERKRRVVSNRGPQHARVVLQTMFENADSRARVNCGKMSSDVFDLELVSKFLNKNGSHLTVIIDSEDVMTSKDSILSTLISRAPSHLGKLDVYVRAESDKRFRHFTVMDGRDLRVETDHSDRIADVYFMDRENATSAESVFDQLVANAKKIV
jgi:hypothetical protein